MADKKNEEIRIGVFVCHCGTNIGGFVDCEKLAEYANSLPSVAHSEHNLYTCSETGLAAIRNAIKEHDLNRVVVASCTPRTHEPLFRDTIQEAGLNRYLFNFVNIRDQCTWVHMKQTDAAFEKSKDLIKMGVAKAARLEALERIVVDINPTALVIGGGVAGMNAALNLSRQGFKTHLVEKEDKLGGRLNSLYKLFPNDQVASEFLENILNKVDSSKNLQVYISSKVKRIEGFIGNYDVDIEKNGDIINLNVGAIIVAVGASVFEPTNLFGYDGKKRITQLELENKFITNDLSAKNIVMIQCVGARNEERVYCSNICCMTALKNAMAIKEINPNANIIILFRDLYTPGVQYEEYFKNARKAGIVFIKYTIDKLPIVEDNEIKVFNDYLGEEVIIPYDLLVLSTPLIANEDNFDLAKMLKVPLEENKFFLEAHVKLRPIDFATDGIYLCGSAKWPVDISETTTQGLAAASRASTILSHKTIEVESSTAYLPDWNKSLCKGCEVCISICPYNAIIKNEEDEIEIIQALCKGCGTCAATCTKHAIEIKHFKDTQILAEIIAFGGEIIE
ncbi:MAG: CoB--CoM heterodisulfide reductase iron-sulfur subunit A family protein [Promethearchaeota archaeon]|nr:MAG: CoB--CoM heterodisulfide reductase iron-sulfur subunit A family protein [Candidatus Lokiarchaeota archaeon]